MLYLLPHGVTKFPRLRRTKIRGLDERASECFKKELIPPLVDLFVPSNHSSYRGSLTRYTPRLDLASSALA